MANNLIKKSNKAKKATTVTPRVEPLTSVWLTIEENEVTGTFRSRAAARESGLGTVHNFTRA